MSWQTIHDRFFVVMVALCAAFMLVVARGAQVRERARLVEPLVAQPDSIAEDQARLAALMEGARLGSGDGPDVIVIAIDGLRADAVSALGGWTPTPALTDFAAGARVAAAVQAPTPERVASRFSLLTGLHPIEHGVHRLRNGGWPRGAGVTDTLPQRLSDAGWSTVGISSDSVGTNQQHPEEGFDVFLGAEMGVAPDGLGYLRADRVTDLALSAFEALDGGPRFLWVEYGDLNTPWVPWEPWIERPLELVSYAMWWPGQIKVGWNKRYQNLMKRGSSVSDDTMLTWRTCYSAELQLIDQELQRLLDGLGVGPSDWVVIVGVNGTYLGEHSLLGEGYDVYQEGVGVPLMIRGPAPVSAPAETVALPSLLLEALGVEAMPGAGDQGLAVSEVRYAEMDVMRASYGQRFKRIRRSWRDVENPERLLILDSSGPEEAYDLSTDALQQQPLDEAAWADELRERAARWLAEREGQGAREHREAQETP